MRYRSMSVVALLIVLTLSTASLASWGMYVGKNLTEDGSVILAGYGDEPSSHYVEIVPAQTHDPDATITVGVTEAARYPGERFEIPQVEETLGYISATYSAFAGFPAPLTNGGLNEKQVAGRDIWSPSRSELREMTPDPQYGLNYSDLARIAMERAATAQEAIEILGALIDEYGFATYGGNSHMFADPNEGWVMIQFAGGQGLWAAERLGPDDIRVFRPGYIGDFPVDFEDDPNFMASENFVSFAVEQGWYDPDSGEPFNVNAVYGTDRQSDQPGMQARAPAVVMMEDWLAERAPYVTVKDAIEANRHPEITRESAGYGQVAHLRSDIPAELTVLWTTVAPPIASPLIPLNHLTEDVPVEYKKHRYLTEGEAARFVSLDFQGRESTEYAFYIFNRMFHLISEHPYDFLDEVVDTYVAYEDNLMEEQQMVETIALQLLDQGEEQLARDIYTYFIMQTGENVLDLVKVLSASIEARTKIHYGIPEPADEPVTGRTDVLY